MLPEGRQHFSVHLFRFSLPVNPRAVEVIDAEFVGAQGDSFGVLVTAHWKSAAGLADDRQPFARFPEHPLGNVARLDLALIPAARVNRESGRSRCCKKRSSPHKSSPPPEFAPRYNPVSKLRQFALGRSAWGKMITPKRLRVHNGSTGQSGIPWSCLHLRIDAGAWPGRQNGNPGSTERASSTWP